MTITAQLNALIPAVAVISAAQGEKLISNLFSYVSIRHEGKTSEEMKEILNWFLDGGEFTFRWKESLPHSERKNSKKRNRTTWFNASKCGITLQLGHDTIKNYVVTNWMQRGAEALVKSALCKEGEFSYYNLSFVDYVRANGAEFKDLGEWK